MTLYVVSTPIGNLEDISPRALKVLDEVAAIAAEDTRHTLRLLNHFGLHKRLIPYHQHTHPRQEEALLELIQEQDVALVTDAGTPGISDPGGKLIAHAVERKIKVVAIPGASALMTALSASGLDFATFSFLGFLPRSAGDQLRLISEHLKPQNAVVVYETAQRIIKTLANLKPALAVAQIVVARELTKKFEEFVYGDYNEIVSALTVKPIRGEITLILYMPYKTYGRSKQKTPGTPRR